MSIVALVKVTLYGPLSEKEQVIEGLQELGCLHLNDLRTGSAEDREVATYGADARDAIQYLRDCPVKRPTPRHRLEIDVPKVVNETLEVRDRSRALSEERTQLRKWIADLEPWGDFEAPEWAYEGELRFWFYVVPLHKLELLQGISRPWRVVSRDHRFAYVVVVATEEPADIPGTQASLDRRPLSALRSRLEQVERELEELDYRRIGLTLYTRAISEALDEADDRTAREQASSRTFDREQVFAIQGWAPAGRTQELRRFASGRRLAITIASPGPQDNPPTLLDNPPALRGGEDLVEFYKIPGYRMWDPSTPVFFSFAVFFAMIFADAGYGLLLGLILLALWKRLEGSDSGERFRGILIALVISTIAYGVIAGSYFGLTPPAGSWLSVLHVLDTADQNFMMWLAIGIGVIHLVYANLYTAWRRRKSPAAMSGVGWACFMTGGACVGVSGSYPALSGLAGFGWAGVVLGGLFVLLFSSESRFSLAPKALFGRLVDGVKGATDITKAFGDVLSYLRLFALGLASFKLAESFNGLAASAFDLGGIGMLLGLAILVVGHGINFVMAIMGGVVHGLRLNVIEFFNWSLPEDGEGFRTFARKAEEFTG